MLHLDLNVVYIVDCYKRLSELIVHLPIWSLFAVYLVVGSRSKVRVGLFSGLVVLVRVRTD